MTRIVLFLIVIYSAIYMAIRTLNAEVWVADGRSYVIFPADFKAVYYLFRPLSYLDSMLTGTGAHIGPHQ